MRGNCGEKGLISRFYSLRLTTREKRFGMRAQREYLRDARIEALEQRRLLNGGIQGSVVDETNGNAGIAGVTIYLDADNDRTLDPGEVNVVTDATGAYLFTNLPAGDYWVREVVPPEYEARTSEDIAYVFDGSIANVFQFANIHFWLVEGTGAADIISAQVDPGGAKVTVNGVSEVRSLAGIRYIMIHGRDGNDQISIDSQLQFSTRIFGDAGDDTLF